MDYLKSIVPSQLIAERGANLVVINPGSNLYDRIIFISYFHIFIIPNVMHQVFIGGSANVRIGLASQQVKDQILNSQLTPTQQLEREKAYDIIASLLKIPFIDGESANNSFPHKVHNYSSTTLESKVLIDAWTNVVEKMNNLPSKIGNKDAQDQSLGQAQDGDDRDPICGNYKFKEFICGDEALQISPTDPYCLHRPIRRGHLNISQHYSLQQVLEDLYTIWEWVLNDNLHIPKAKRNMYSAILVVPETFDSREIKETLSIVLRDLCFSSAVVHQEGLAAAFGSGLSTACVVNMGAQVTSIICVEDGVALPNTCMTLPFGGEDISRCLLWVQRHRQTWPLINTGTMRKPHDMVTLQKFKDSCCQITVRELDGVAYVHSYEDVNMRAGRVLLNRLSVPPMGLFYPPLLVSDEYPPPPRTWFNDYEDMLEDTWHAEFPRRSDLSDNIFPGGNGGLYMWENYPIFPTKLKKEENLGLAEAITSSILSTGRIDLQRKLFCSIHLIGGVALTNGLVAATEDRVLHAIPSNEAIDTVEVLQLRENPSSVTWKGGAILGILDLGREAWIQREDWIHNGIHIGSGRKYKDSFFLQAQAMSYMNS
ncbi:hypothetical protein Sjap_008115 [Stephania japonica]|uniref:Actin-related protein 9 n=1 Tax=Stephania japonica TaxID=461633 RepID=A0AAP0JPR2_9MAGN